MSARVFDSFGHHAVVEAADYAREASEPSEVPEVEPPRGELRKLPELRKPPANEKRTLSTVALLRRSGVRLWLKDDGWSIKTSPALVGSGRSSMQRSHFELLVENLDEIRSELIAERGGRAL